MIKNVIFDYGNTIVRYVPKEITDKLCDICSEDKAKLTDIVFDRKYWDRLDDGSLTQQEFCKLVKSAVPEHLQTAALDICNNWYSVLPVIDGIEEFIKKLKCDGYKLYILSNIGDMFVLDNSKIKLEEYFDGMVLSSEIKLVKPSQEIFKHLLEKYSLKPEECAFVDDIQHNIDAAIKAGIYGIHFEGDVNKVYREIYGKSAY